MVSERKAMPTGCTRKHCKTQPTATNGSARCVPLTGSPRPNPPSVGPQTCPSSGRASRSSIVHSLVVAMIVLLSAPDPEEVRNRDAEAGQDVPAVQVVALGQLERLSPRGVDRDGA